MKTLIDKINHFESLPECTVAKFNEIFTSKLEGLDQNLEVEIGELADTDTTRFLTVGKLIIKHNFTPIKIVEEYLNENGNVSYKKEPTYRDNRNGKWRNLR